MDKLSINLWFLEAHAVGPTAIYSLFGIIALVLVFEAVRRGIASRSVRANSSDHSAK
jgi:hypothetical protein